MIITLPGVNAISFKPPASIVLHTNTQACFSYSGRIAATILEQHYCIPGCREKAAESCKPGGRVECCHVRQRLRCLSIKI